MKQQGEMPMRLHVFLASSGVASRRACEEMIRQGRVSVDDHIAVVGEKILGNERITIDGKLIDLNRQKSFRYILLNKPKGYLSSSRDSFGRACAIELIAADIPERLYNIGRLDQWSSGLLLFTNDGDLAAKLMHPSSEIEKEYFVQTDKPLPETFASRFIHGIVHEGVRYRARSVRQTAPDKVYIVLVEGKNRDIRRVLDHFDLRALILERIRIGPIKDKNLPSGKWRDLSEQEIAALKSLVNSTSSLPGGRRA